MLNEDTEPSAKPARKKKRAMALDNASMAQAIQNVKRMSSSTTPQSREDPHEDGVDPSPAAASTCEPGGDLQP
jgi:hypothetical protein